jgi:4-hydroxy-tetrahydrodipicolinate reductase
MLGISIYGITGRMGQSLLRALGETPQLSLCGAVASGTSARLGLDAAAGGEACGVTVTADADAALTGAAVALDFSLPQCVAGHARACVAAKVPLLVGTTGFDAKTRMALEAAALDIAVLVAPNTSIAVALMLELAARAARTLGPGYAVEIFEAHHRMKRAGLGRSGGPGPRGKTGGCRICGVEGGRYRRRAHGQLLRPG